MKFNEESKIIYFEKTKLNQQQIDNLYIPKDYQEIISSITFHNGIYYYYKDVTLNSLINELIGSYLAQKLGLDTVDYKIGIMNNKFYVLSKIFYQTGFQYYDCKSYFRKSSFDNITTFQTFLSFFYLSEFEIIRRLNSTELLESILKLIALDLKMGQFDRHNKNLFLKKDSNGIVDLAPQFDYGGSYHKKGIPFKIYDNPLITIRKNKLSLQNFSKQYPNFVKYICILYNISMDNILNDLEQNNLLIFEQKEKSFYLEQDKENNKILKKILY